MDMEQLLQHAAQLGVRIKFRDLGRRHGEVHSSGLIIVNPNRSGPAVMITVAHEIGHVVHHHDWSDARHDRELDERQAETYAARLLVSTERYRVAEACVGSDPRALAKELDLTPRLIHLWKTSFSQELLTTRRHLRAV